MRHCAGLSPPYPKAIEHHERPRGRRLALLQAADRPRWLVNGSRCNLTSLQFRASPWRVAFAGGPRLTPSTPDAFELAFSTVKAALLNIVAIASLFLRARGVTDIDDDGKTDVFTDRFLDEI